MTNAPHDRPIMVFTKEEGLLLPVQWRADRFEVIDGDGSWVEEDDIESWEEPLELMRAEAQAA